MKKSIVFFFIIICTTINGQWYSSIENDPFDGLGNFSYTENGQSIRGRGGLPQRISI